MDEAIKPQGRNSSSLSKPHDNNICLLNSCLKQHCYCIAQSQLDLIKFLCSVGGPYAAFGGRDASRGLATFSVSCEKEGYDDLSDLNPQEMESVREWEMQFTGKAVTLMSMLFIFIVNS